jgi:hypothetical protein
MPRLTTFRIRFPVWPVKAPLRTRSANAAIRSRTACTSGTTSVPSTTRVVSRGARSATWRTARSSVTLIRSPRNMASIRAASPASSARRRRSASVSSVTRFFE